MTETDGAKWNLGEILKWTTQWFEKKNIAAARRQAEEVICFVLEIDRLELYLQFEYIATPGERQVIKDLITRRASGEPLQYITGYQKFCDIKIKTDSRALIPRVETEQLVQKLVSQIKGLENPVVLDIGTGTGCIAVALAKNTNARIYCGDISRKALELAQENVKLLDVEKKVSLHYGDCFQAFENISELQKGEVDLVVSNPPYIGFDEKPKLSRTVIDYEPEQALFCGDTGDGILLNLLQESQVWLKCGGTLAFEIGPRHSNELIKRGEASGYWQKTDIEKDDQGLERFFFAVKK